MAKDGVITINPPQTDNATFCVLGRTPLIINRMSEKAKHDLMGVKSKVSVSERNSTLKHDPPAEFRASVHTSPTGPTRLVFPSAAFKGAMATAAIEAGGMAKTSVNRLCYVEGEAVALFGVPEMFSCIVRTPDIKRTPDVRTRAILREWACFINVRYVKSCISGQALANLLIWAGEIIGVGEFRQEKGKGNYGTFSLVDPTDPKFQSIVAGGGRQAQDDALAAAMPYNDETAELLAWFNVEAPKSGKKSRAA